MYYSNDFIEVEYFNGNSEYSLKDDNSKSCLFIGVWRNKYQHYLIETLNLTDITINLILSLNASARLAWFMLKAFGKRYKIYDCDRVSNPLWIGYKVCGIEIAIEVVRE